MTSVTGSPQTRRLDPRRRVRTIGDLLVTTSIVQSALGIALLVAPAWTGRHLAGIVSSPELARILRVAGGASLVIGVWCMLGRLSESGLPRSRPLDLVPGLVVYNGCAVAVTRVVGAVASLWRVRKKFASVSGSVTTVASARSRSSSS